VSMGISPAYKLIVLLHIGPAYFILPGHFSWFKLHRQHDEN